MARYMRTSAAEARMAETLVCTLCSRPEWRDGGRASRASPKREENLLGGRVGVRVGTRAGARVGARVRAGARAGAGAGAGASEHDEVRCRAAWR